MTRVSLADIAFDAGTQIRAAINEATVAAYAERMTEGDQFPPVVLFHDGNQHYLADGFHRLMAAQRNHFRDIDADVRAGTRQDALWFALGANNGHGLQMTSADKRNAIKLALQAWGQNGKTQSEIARQLGIAESTLSYHASQLSKVGQLVAPDRVTGKDGKSYPASLNAPPNPKVAQVEQLVQEGQSNEAIRAAVGGVSNSLIAEARKSLGLSIGPDRSKAAVAQRRQDIRDMAARGFSTQQIAAALGITESGCGEIASKEGIVIHADRVVGKARRHDANRIISQMVTDAENLCADVNLIEFADIDRARLVEWIEALKTSREQLGGFIRRLIKEQQKHVEAA